MEFVRLWKIEEDVLNREKGVEKNFNSRCVYAFNLYGGIVMRV